jgi:hypothetical protein
MNDIEPTEERLITRKRENVFFIFSEDRKAWLSGAQHATWVHEWKRNDLWWSPFEREADRKIETLRIEGPLRQWMLNLNNWVFTPGLQAILPEDEGKKVFVYAILNPRIYPSMSDSTQLDFLRFLKANIPSLIKIAPWTVKAGIPMHPAVQKVLEQKIHNQQS